MQRGGSNGRDVHLLHNTNLSGLMSTESPDSEKAAVRKLYYENETMREGESWFAIPAKWYGVWAAHVNFTLKDDVEDEDEPFERAWGGWDRGFGTHEIAAVALTRVRSPPAAGPRPGPLECSELTDESGFIKSGLRENSDYVFVHKAVGDYLHGIYGGDMGKEFKVIQRRGRHPELDAKAVQLQVRSGCTHSSS